MKNKYLIRIITLICSTLFVFTSFACGGNKPDVNVEDPTQKNENHNTTVTDTTTDLILNGETQYVLVFPENYSSYEKFAKDEFITLFKEATNINIKSITDTGLTFDQNSKYISIGNTTLLATCGETIDKKPLTDNGVRIITKGNTVFLSGGDLDGVVYAVYDYMKIMFNFEQYYVDCMVIDRNVQNLKFKEIDVTDIPDVRLREKNYGVYNDAIFRSRRRNNYNRNDSIPIYKDFNDQASKSVVSHGTCTVLSRDNYGETHPKWFSDGGEQWCYTAHGDTEEYNLMVEEIVKKCLNSLQFHKQKDYPTLNTFDLMMEDNKDACTCQGCNDAAALHGGQQSGAAVVLINNVSKLFKQKYTELKEANPDDDKYTRDVDDFRFRMFAYFYLVGSPTVYNEETKKMEAVVPEVVCEDNVIVKLAITNLYSWYSILDPENKSGKQTIEGWGAICKNLHMWIYTGNYGFFVYPYEDFACINNESYKFMVDNGADSIYNQAEWDSEPLTGWSALKMYVDSSLQWDTSLDVNVLVDNWFKAMFKYDDVVAQMRELYEEISTHTRGMYYEIIKANKAPWGGYPNNIKAYPYQLVSIWIDKFDAALETLEKYKNDADYEMVYKHVEVEAMSPIFIMLDLHQVRLPENRKNELVNRMIYDVESMGLYKMKTGEGSHTSVYDWILAVAEQ